MCADIFATFVLLGQEVSTWSRQEKGGVKLL